jgi:FHA domain-containing protein
MIIRIEVITCNGAPPPKPMVADFDELGGNIGRAEDSTLVLPDPERFISRTHAAVECRGGHYVILDKGKALPVAVNGRPLGNGHESPIGDGDEVVIGVYRMRVAAVAPAAVRQTTSELPTPPLSGTAVDDPLALFGAAPISKSASPAASLMDDPFAMPSRGAGGRQEVDDSLLQAPPPDASAPVRLPEDVDFGLGLSVASGSVDDLFGLSRGGGGEPFPPSSALAGTFGQGEASRSVDPLAAFGGAPAMRPAAPQRDDTPELQGSFKMPQARPDPALAKHEGLLEQGQAGPAESAAPAASAVAASPGAESVDPLALFGGGKPSGERLGVVASSPSAAAPQSALLAAFLQGAGVPDLQLAGGLTPETMNLFGQLIREATQGTLDLLLARATIKREVRADMTMIVGRENNPLKFSPNVETALTHLLAPSLPGFLPPMEAMKDAYDDLRSHQFGFMAGMRAALAAVLQRFDPETLERQLTEKSLMDSVLPMNREAKLWNLFRRLYKDIAKEAEDDFHTLFGREFVRAYQAQVERLNRPEDNGDR